VTPKDVIDEIVLTILELGLGETLDTVNIGFVLSLY
jgi:hypothetical protein